MRNYYLAPKESGDKGLHMDGVVSVLNSEQWSAGVWGDPSCNNLMIFRDLNVDNASRTVQKKKSRRIITSLHCTVKRHTDFV